MILHAGHLTSCILIEFFLLCSWLIIQISYLGLLGPVVGSAIDPWFDNQNIVSKHINKVCSLEKREKDIWIGVCIVLTLVKE
jgi:hypothetical protein